MFVWEGEEFQVIFFNESEGEACDEIMETFLKPGEDWWWTRRLPSLEKAQG